jgi:nitroreductase
VSSVNSDALPNYDQVLELVRSRRSRRLFRDEPVDATLIDNVLEAARFSPSGHNAQSTEFVVVRGSDDVQAIGLMTSMALKRMVSPFRSPVGRMIMRLIMGRRGADYVADLAPELEHVASAFEEGTDGILHEAPALVLFCADSVGGFMASINANLALQNATLAAEALGLGCFYAGFLLIASQRDVSIAKHVRLPPTHKIYGALALGHPVLKFSKWPDRNAPKVAWIENGKPPPLHL